MKHQWEAFLLSVAFLTRLPVGRCLMVPPQEFPTALGYFPVVGLIVGAIGAGTYLLAQLWLEQSLAVLLSMLATIWVTGSFHEDGLADSADGLWGGHHKEKRLEIMKDSRIGTHGSIALWFGLTFKFLLGVKLAAFGWWVWPLALLAGHALGRAASLSLIIFQDYVGEGPGSKALPFIKKRPIIPCLSGLAFAIAVMAALWPGPALLAGPWLVGLVALCGWYFHTKIGGITGDCLGATNQIAEIVFYAVLVQQLS
jgi:adenosylcobinamide-GDP ribazoletransferase